MTNAYKNNVLDYVVNQVTEQVGQNIPLFDNSTNIAKSISNQIKEHLPNSNVIYSGYLYDNNSQLIIAYGYYKNTNDDEYKYGYIYIADKNLNEIKMITEFVSGTKLFPIQQLHQDENGTFYAISVIGTTARILLLNNLFAKIPSGDYQAVLRASYIIPNSENYHFTFYTTFYKQTLPVIKKAQNSATYYIVCHLRGSTQNTQLIKFTINVGAENEWNVIDLKTQFYTYDYLLELDSVHIYGVDNSSYYIEYLYKNDALITKVNHLFNLDAEIVLAKNTNNIYLVASDYNTNYLVFDKVINGQINMLFVISNDLNDIIFNMELTNGIVFLKAVSSGKFYAGILQDDFPYFSSGVTISNTRRFNFVLYNYNLLNIYVDTSTEDYSTLNTTKYILDYNPLNYNGNAYSNYDSTKIKKARLYSNGEMIFARNIYNQTINNATTTSTVQIPNTMLNNDTINKEYLISNTNVDVCNKTATINKNIYETLYVNFINTFNVKDEDTNTQYPNAASYINQNVNIGTKQNCELSHIGKVAINYTDKIIVQNIVWSYDTDHYVTSFTVDCTTEIPTIDFMSNDETTIYITKELDVNVGSYYVIEQKLRIE